MDRFQYLLTKLAEECTEVAQMALKCQQFGLEDVKPEQAVPYTNAERLHSELNDLMASIEMLNGKGLGYEVDEYAVCVKKKKVNKYIQMSADLGFVKL